MSKEEEQNKKRDLYEEKEIDSIEKHIETHFGDFKNVFHEITSPDLHIDLAIIEPGAFGHDYYTIVTMGAGAYQMKVPEGYDGPRRIELLITLPADWEIHNNGDEKWYWPLRCLKRLARFPKDEDTWLGWGHTVPNGEPFAENTELNGVMLTMPYGFGDKAATCLLPNGEKVGFYQILPLYESEMNFKKSAGAEALEEHFPDDFDMVVDVARPNVVSNKKWAVKVTDMKELLPDWEGAMGCFATDRIMVDGEKVGYMYREAPDNEHDSGWRFMAGDESDEYMDNAANSGFYSLNTVANNDPDIIQFLKTPFNVAFKRNKNGNFEEVEYIPTDDSVEEIEDLISLLEEQIENCDDTDFDDAVATCEKIECICEREKSEKLFEIYANAAGGMVTTFSDYDVPQKAEPYLKKLAELHHKYIQNKKILKLYAEALAFLGGDGYLLATEANESRALELFECLYQLDMQYPDTISETVAQMYSSLIDYYLREDEFTAYKYIELIEDYYNKHNDDTDVILTYLRTLDFCVTYYCRQKKVRYAMKWYAKLEEVIVQKGDYYNWQVGSLQQITECCIENKESADAEKYYTLLYNLEAMHGIDSTTGNAKISRILAETSIEFFNMYILEKKLSKALEVFGTLKKLEERLLGDAAIYYSRAVYALCCYYSKNDDIETATEYSNELKRLTCYENSSEYIDNYGGTLFFLITAYDEQGDEAKADKALAELEKLSEESDVVAVTSHLSRIYFNRLVNCFVGKDYKNADVYFRKMEKQLTRFDSEIPDLIENYIDAAMKYVDLFSKSKNMSSLTELYNTIDKTPISPKESRKENIMSFILYNLSILDTDIKNEEKLLEKLKLMAEQSYASADTILRSAKLAYNIHYDYSDSGNFEKADAHYQYLKSLYAMYADSDYTVNNNPLGLEIAFRVATAALNYSIDYKKKSKKPSFFFFKNKSSDPSKILIDEISLLTKKWTGEEAKPLHDCLVKMKRNV